jgi:hypothetical protein
LLKLLFQDLALDQQATNPFAPRKRYIPGENDPPLRARQGGDLVVACVAGIERIKAQQAQPLGQASQHGIGQKQWA